MRTSISQSGHEGPSRPSFCDGCFLSSPFQKLKGFIIRRPSRERFRVRDSGTTDRAVLQFVNALRQYLTAATTHHIRVREPEAVTENGVEKKSHLTTVVFKLRQILP